MEQPPEGESEPSYPLNRWQRLRSFIGGPITLVVIIVLVISSFSVGFTLGKSEAEQTAEIGNDNLERQVAELDRRNFDQSAEIDRLRAVQPDSPHRIVSTRGCPLEDEASRLAAIQVVATHDDVEHCRFEWSNPRPGEPFPVVCPIDFICTFELTNNRMRVVLGNGASVDRGIVGGTWRYIPAYERDDRDRDPCQLVHDEQGYFGADDPEDTNLEEPSGFLVVPEGFIC